MSHTHRTGSNVCYNDKQCTVFKLRTVDSQPAYLLREIETGAVHDNVLESAVMACSINEIIDNKWATFNYTGDNGHASNWILNNLIKNIASATGLSWGANENNTEYRFTASGQTWTKTKSA